MDIIKMTIKTKQGKTIECLGVEYLSKTGKVCRITMYELNKPENKYLRKYLYNLAK